MLNADPAEDFKLFQKAAKQGDADAQYNLGVMYSRGSGVGKNEVEAVRWYLKASDQGIAEAQYNLSNMYSEGKGTKNRGSFYLLSP